MKEQIGDESIFLRISELKRGNVQFTDSIKTSCRKPTTTGSALKSKN
jgi:hypothetical protein